MMVVAACFAGSAWAADISARVELDKTVTKFVGAAYVSTFEPVQVALVIQNDSDTKRNIALKPKYRLQFKKVSPLQPYVDSSNIVAIGSLNSIYPDMKLTLTLQPHTKMVIAFAEIPGPGFNFTTYKGYSFPATYVVQVELPGGLPNTDTGAMTEAMLVVK